MPSNVPHLHFNWNLFEIRISTCPLECLFHKQIRKKNSSLRTRWVGFLNLFWKKKTKQNKNKIDFTYYSYNKLKLKQKQKQFSNNNKNKHNKYISHVQFKLIALPFGLHLCGDLFIFLIT